MSKVGNYVKEQLNQYEEATGDHLPINALARTAMLGSLGVLLWETSADMSTSAGVVPFAVFLGSTIVNWLTHKPAEYTEPSGKDLIEEPISDKID